MALAAITAIKYQRPKEVIEMIGRKAVIGLSLLCALLFSAFAVQSASAANAVNATAFTCAPSGTGFEDAHCDKANGAGKFSHVALPTKLGETTEVDITNAKVLNNTTEADSHTLFGEPFKVPVEITCKTVTGTADVGNTEPSAGVHKVSGKLKNLEYTNCEAKKVTNCTKVKEPIKVSATGEALEGLTGPKGEANAMGGEIKAEAGKPFTELTLEGTCAIAGKPFNVEGSAVATNGPTGEEIQTAKHSGATGCATYKMTEETLTAGGKKAKYKGCLTATMKGGGNPIVGTTVT